MELREFLEKLNIDRTHFVYFENGTFDGIRYNKVAKIYIINITLDEPLPASVYLSTYDAIKKLLSSKDEKVQVIFEIKLSKKDYNPQVVKDYILTYIASRVKNPNEFDFLKEQSMNIRNDEVILTYNSALIEDLINDLKDKLERFINTVGYDYLKIKTVYIEPEQAPFDYEKDKEEYDQLIAKYKQLVEQEEKAKKEAEEAEKHKFKGRMSFKNKTFVRVELDNIPENIVDIESEVKVFSVSPEGKSEKRFRLNVTNYKTSYTAHVWTSKAITADTLKKLVGKWIIIRGTLLYNQFDKEVSLEMYNYDESDKKDEIRVDSAEEKRVELHAHTNMSAMDGICDVSKLVEQAAIWGHKAIAITDHVAVQSFPDAQNAQARLKKQGYDIKILYGIELNVAPHQLDIIANPSNQELKEASYVFFDLETSGLSCVFDDIIEFGAIKYQNSKEVERIDILINPKHEISKFTTELTGITNEMLKNKPVLEDVIDRIRDFIGDSILVAHNASFDIGFLTRALNSKITNPIIDTLPLCRYLFQEEKRYTLGAMCRLKGIDYDEENAHRADYDAEVLKDLYIDGIMPELYKDVLSCKHQDLGLFQSPEVTRKMHPYHTNLLVQNSIGMKNLFKILSIANTDYFTAKALVPPHIIDEHREGLLIGSSCARGEIFELASTKSEDEVIKAMSWYDYIEIQPLDQYQILVDTAKVESIEKVKQIILFMIECARKANKMVCATGDLHYINADEAIAREVFISTPAIGGGYHPLFDYRHRIKKYPIQDFKTTQEMLDAFAWLGNEQAEEFVIKNPNRVADMIEYCYPIKSKLYPPTIEGADEQLRTKCYETAHKMYGKNLPSIVEERLEKELKSIISFGNAIMYVIASKCVEHSNKQGFLVGSRGSVGSSLTATFAGITEVNPLKPHYRCPNCGYSDFSIDEKQYRSGFDLPDKNCPECGHLLKGDGHNIPFETFLGFKGEKTPDIDLNFSALNQADSHLFIRELFGEDHVFRAGTISSAASKTAFGYAKKYYENQGVEIRNAEAARIALMCEGVKRTTGQHPGGLIVIPNEMDVYDFTPVGHPADDVDSEWLTTHFAFEAIHENVLKLDMLGHVDPTVIRMLQNLTGIDPKDVPLNDKKVISQFRAGSPYDSDEITAAGLPEFGTTVARKMLAETKPTTFADLTKISGLSHGTDVYFGNIQVNIKNGECNIVNCIGCRDDIMIDLINYGIEPSTAFEIMEFVRKDKIRKDKNGRATWDRYKALLVEHQVPSWYINACEKIKYLFPKAHAVAYCLMAVRIAWFKYYYPLEYYATYFTWRSDAYDVEAMNQGYNVIRKKFAQLKTKVDNNETLSVKENALYTFYEIALEMYKRNISFANIDLYKSDDQEFKIDKEKNQIIPPFRVCDGVGSQAAISVIEARKDGIFVSKQDLRERTKLNDTNIKLLTKLGVLKELSDSDQLTLF